ncbi:tRNA preQ1(34) S-adenosylmethionine ribosyltransferase-isomerase QueA [soil metagenome]
MPPSLPTSAFDYELPSSLIAHHPAPERDTSRLLLLRRHTGDIEDRAFRDILDLVTAGDVLVLNETRVIPARLLGTRPGGGPAEFILLNPAAATASTATAPVPLGPDDADWPSDWFALVRPGAKLRPGRVISVGDDLDVEIVAALPDGTRHVRLRSTLTIRQAVERFGRMPLPPYIERDAEPQDSARYQTVYARTEGSVAAPTAGLHFTPAVLDTLRNGGVHIATIVLHVGVGTFRPVDAEDPAEHRMHAEYYQVTADQAEVMNRARAQGGRLWAVGTTVARTLETAVERPGAPPLAVPGSGASGTAGDAASHRADDRATSARIQSGSGWTSLFIRPGFEFLAVDRLITNFHLPRSTLLMLVSAFAGYDGVMHAYRHAVDQRYRFYSYGDAMVIL